MGDEDHMRIAREWQPIETAPRDGTPFLAHDHSWDRPISIRWHRPWQKWVINGVLLDLGDWGEPAFWAPMPVPPTGYRADERTRASSLRSQTTPPPKRRDMNFDVPEKVNGGRVVLALRLIEDRIADLESCNETLAKQRPTRSTLDQSDRNDREIQWLYEIVSALAGPEER